MFFGASSGLLCFLAPALGRPGLLLSGCQLALRFCKVEAREPNFAAQFLRGACALRCFHCLVSGRFGAAGDDVWHRAVACINLLDCVHTSHVFLVALGFGLCRLNRHFPSSAERPVKQNDGDELVGLVLHQGTLSRVKLLLRFQHFKIAGLAI